MSYYGAPNAWGNGGNGGMGGYGGWEQPHQNQPGQYGGFVNGVQNNFAQDSFFNTDPTQRKKVDTQDVWKVYRRNPYEGTQQKYDYGYGQYSPAQGGYGQTGYGQGGYGQPAPQPSYGGDFGAPQYNQYGQGYGYNHQSSNHYQQPTPSPAPTPYQPTPPSPYGQPPSQPDQGGFPRRRHHTGHRSKKHHDQDFYANLLDNTDANPAGNDLRYRYHYSDGYDRDQSDKLDDYFNQNNQKIADNFQKFDPNSNKVVPVPGGPIPTPAPDNTMISGVFGTYVPAPLREETNIIIDNGAPQIFNNSFIQSFTNDRQNNMLDDLQELVSQSTSIAKARSQAGAGKYTDPDFPPHVKSIIGFGEGKMREADYVKFPWLRPEEYFKGAPYHVYEKLGSDDIEQGSLGDCYFLASISAVAEFPERCQRLFLTKEIDKQAIYAVALCHDGIWTDVVMDDLIPCQPVSKTPLFNRSSGQELWVILLEKAWAKINGGFQNIAAGLAREALRTLTGASCKTFFTQQDREGIWKAIYVGNEMNFIMTAASDDLDNGSDAYQDKVGICGSHAYSLLAAYEIVRDGPGGSWRKLNFQENPTGQVERLVKLRNPWGTSEWKGTWSDSDSQWTDALRKQLEMTNNPDDGIFCITFNDFCKYFSDLQICYYHDNYKYSAVKLQSQKGEKVMLVFEIHVEGVYYLSVNQKMTRAFPKSKKYAYSNLAFAVNKVGPGKECKFVGGQTKDDFENWIEVKLTPGNYAVEITTNWTSFVNEFSFSVYGPEMIPIGVTNANALPQNMTERAIKSAAEEDTETPTLNFASQGHPDISYKIFDNKNGAGYVFFRNDSPNVTLAATADLTKSQNIALKPPRQGLTPHVTVDPGQSTSIAFEATKFPYSFQMQLATSFDVVENRQELIERTRQSTFIVKRKDEHGNELPIWAHIFRYEEGTGVLYVNKHPELTLTESVKFNLDNCHIEGTAGDSFEVVIRPNSEKFLSILRTDKSKPFNAEVVQVSNKVARAV